MTRTNVLFMLFAASVGLVSARSEAQSPAAVPLPVSPPTAAAAGMAHQNAQLLAALDTNHNGRLDPAEIEAARAGLINPAAIQGGNTTAAKNMANFQKFLLNKFDANGNGVLDLPEVEAARLALSMAGMNQAAFNNGANQLGGNQFGANQAGGNQAGGNQPADKNAKQPGAPIKEVKRKNALLANYDKNGDGKLDAEERKAMEAAKAKPKKPAKGAKRPAAKTTKRAAVNKAAQAAAPAANQD
jgi:hypothetical protein